MDKFKVSDIANLLRVSQVTVYKKVKKLKKELSTHTIKEKGILFFDPEGMEIIRQSISTAPKETILPSIPVTDTAIIPQEKNDPLEEIRKVLMLLVEENRALRSEVSNLQKSLEFRKTEMPANTADSQDRINTQKENTPAPIRADVIYRDKLILDPLAGIPWYQKLYFELFEPEKLRRYEN